VRIGIGAIVGIQGGPATYARELVRALAAVGGHEYTVFTDRPEAFAGIDVATVLVPLPTPWHQLTWDHLRLPTLVARSGVDLYHGTKNVLPWRLRVPAVVTVHDLAVYACPETFALPQRWHFKVLVPRSVVMAQRVIAVSMHARDDMMTRLGLPAGRVVAIPNAVGDAYLEPQADGAVAALRARHGLGDQLVACVGTVQPRKHVERVIEAFVAAGAATRGWELVIAGRIRPGYVPPWLRSLPAGVRWLGPLDDAALCALYAASEIAMSASEYEGFGLTICEAMASGCAVIAVETSSIPEVVGQAGMLVSRSDPDLLAAALARLLAEPETRRALGRAARSRAMRFTWEETARQTRAVYESVLDAVAGGQV
jgi:glycosyltransferase involved in cell wall biosynthesis